MANLIEENMYPLIEENPNKLVPNQKKKLKQKFYLLNYNGLIPSEGM